ncbi:uncharacterized protein AMSG_09360 [Thecamonas trahens ATCC 50062]|uniref:Uncharacterized protein n=1 Tax=Thecamonas trahens ATCC 50062 TaxID=461836 RepID=A0A0L0DL68_THETB|nr:hypothetical protein AMSG_09360 [Thecamonas trahens ATCC 50062]KNC53064.1 hypothetical protein AMSG_09360 [Thecamonas trahens ATCC 50062]|eukprot:XP_013754740.1 hypothetical protein AMSG_09360 [Thecamonas trahens ATCC 50062]
MLATYRNEELEVGVRQFLGALRQRVDAARASKWRAVTAASRRKAEAAAAKRRARRALPGPELDEDVPLPMNVDASALPTDSSTSVKRYSTIAPQRAGGGETVLAVKLPRVRRLPMHHLAPMVEQLTRSDDDPHLRFLPWHGDDKEVNVDISLYSSVLGDSNGLDDIVEIQFLIRSTFEAFGNTMETAAVLGSLVGARAYDLLRRYNETVDTVARRAGRVARQQQAVLGNAELTNSVLHPGVVLQRVKLPASAQFRGAGRRSEDGEVVIPSDEALHESYHSLFCRTCYTYGCDLHSIEPQNFPPKPQIPPCPKVLLDMLHPVGATEQSKFVIEAEVWESYACGPECHLHDPRAQALMPSILVRRREMASEGGSSGASGEARYRKLMASLRDGFTMTQDLHGWLPYEIALLSKGFTMYATDYCAVARMVPGRTCRQVKTMLRVIGLSEEDEASLAWILYFAAQEEPGPAPRLGISSSQVQNPDEMSNPHLRPCSHLGACTDNCSCVRHRGFCTELCSCTRNCPRRFPGCACRNGCTNKSCPCRMAFRECVPGICRCPSNDAEVRVRKEPLVADSLRRMLTTVASSPQDEMMLVQAAAMTGISSVESGSGSSESSGSASDSSSSTSLNERPRKRRASRRKRVQRREPVTGTAPPAAAVQPCRNLAHFNKVHNKVVVGISTVAGWGLFAGQPISRGQFIGEYVGEVVSSTEVERRHSEYSSMRISYVFDYNRDFVIDAFRKGSGTKLINHSDEPNVHPMTKVVNGVERVGLYASRDLRTGDELLFCYNYDKEKREWYLDSDFQQILEAEGNKEAPLVVE